MNSIQKTGVGPPAVASPASRPEAPTVSRERTRWPIVGIGASAGGLEAYEEFFRHLPSESGLAFVLVLHLDPGHASLLAEILQRSTAMPVLEATDRAVGCVDHVYVIPPNQDMTISNGQLCLFAPILPRGQRMPIDAFLRSLADDQGDNAVGVVLSGTGTDGTLGLRAIHGAGGITLVQEPASAKFAGMPQSAIRAGYATHVVPVADMPTVLLAATRQLATCREGSPAPSTPAAAENADEIEAVLRLLRAATGHDFSHYKKGTVSRRIARRVVHHQLPDIASYRAYIEAHADESQALFKDLLINVTSFFRDPEAVTVLRQQVLPQLLADKPAGYVLRIWVAGCASGEEAYSIAMLLREFMNETGTMLKVQIYSTDLDKDAIATARAGFYPPNVAADLTPARLQAFFVREDAGYRVRKEIREMLVFAVQNVIKDAPFTKLDLISCRNVMIYLDPELQNRLICSLHYALKPNGVLFLSPAEGVGNHAELFAPIDRRWKFYRATDKPHRVVMTGDLAWPMANAGRSADHTDGNDEPANLAELTRRALLQSFAPASVVTDAMGNILFVHGDTSRFLHPAQGRATLNVVDMALEGLQAGLRAALHGAAEKGAVTSGRQLPARIDGDFQQISLSVRPLTGTGSSRALLLVSFAEVPPTTASAAANAELDQASPETRRVEELERDLAQTWENLQATIERQQISNEELMSANEELQSTNEELQSTVEELETTKEELQSINEELVTVNSELQANIAHLGLAQNDLKDLLDNISGIIFLDGQLRIRRFTREALDLYHLQDSDFGRPLADIKSTIDGHELLVDAQAVLDSRQSVEQEVRSVSGRSYQVRLQPYRTLDGDSDGVVMTFTDISARIEAGSQTLAARQLFESIVDTLREPLLVLDGELTVVAASASFYKRFQVTKEGTVGRRLYDLGNGQWNIPALRELLGSILPWQRTVEGFAVDLALPGAGSGKMLLNARRIEGGTALILLAMEEVASA